MKMARVITINCFDEWSVNWLAFEIANIMNEDQSVIPIIIDSFGGTPYSAFRMIDLLKSTGKPITTIIQGKAMSCGSLLSTVGTKGMRFMSENATMMIHDAAWGNWGKHAELIARAEETKRISDLALSHFDKTADKPNGFFDNEIMLRRGSDWFLSPQNALDYGLIDQIKCPPLFSSLDIDDLLLYKQIVEDNHEDDIMI
jgi:ATP-dependent protease ClpP protease subunit